ncbi:MAG: class I SAM-dependent rRNA methyltransferase [Deltaproteobacteria bacterium]|nr:class I SAM-dependent rRNA methyltransferase [Deltaproteobacteria bacterium]
MTDPGSTTRLVRGLARGREVTLSRDLRRDLKRGHPWVYADAVRLGAGLEPGEIVTVLGGDGRDKRAVGRGYVDPTGPLAVRMCTLDRSPVDDGWATLQLEHALALRTTLFARGDTTGYRLVNGEGDGLPGLVVDRYGETLVIKTDGPIADAFWDVDGLAAHLAALTGATAVYGRVRSRGGAEGRALVGPAPSSPVVFRELGLTFEADVVAGQKTGFFFDQRENRARVGELAAGRRVLNAFGYTGGFSVHAGRGGARHVTTLDLARPAIDAAEANWRRNGLPPEAHAGVVADAFELLEQTTDRWDLVVLDPPAFAPGKQALPQALAAYRRLVVAGARVALPGALMLVASCSAHVRMHDLVGAIEDGVGEARRRATLLFASGQPPDHPSPLACPELAYLKAVYLRLA